MIITGIVASGINTIETVTLTISPAVNGLTTWTFPTDGDLILYDSPFEWTLTPNQTFNRTVKMWGGGGSPYSGTGGNPNRGFSGGGGAATANVTFEAGVAYKMRSPNLSYRTPSSSPTTANNWANAVSGCWGAGNAGSMINRTPSANSSGGTGGGYAGIFRVSVSQVNAILMAGGGGGGGALGTFNTDYTGRGGHGGGTVGGAGDSAASALGANNGGQGGTQSAGAGALQGGHGHVGTTSYGTGGGGGGGYWGGYAGGGSSSGGGSGGGGGSGFFSSNTSRVQNAILYSGGSAYPGNDSDPDRIAVSNSIGWGASLTTYSSRGMGLIIIKAT